MKYGLVLAGGGGKGAYQIGAWKALRELEIEITAVTGTSIGALNGALIVQDMFDAAIELWSNINVEQIMGVDGELFRELTNLNLSTLPKLNTQSMIAYISELIEHRGINILPLIEMITLHLDEDKMRHSSIDFGLVTVSLTEHRPLEYFIKDIPTGKLLDYMLATAYLPGFMPIELDGKRFLDGGFYDNLPINLMVKKGITDIIAIDLHAIGRKRPVRAKNLNVIYISPSEDLGKLLEFDSERSQRNIKMGYLDTLRIFHRFNGFRYFLTEVPTTEDILPFINQLTPAQIEEVLTIIKIKGPFLKRTLLESAMPQIASIFGADSTYDYNDLLITIVEYLSEVYHIERLSVYTFNELLSLVVTAEIEVSSKPITLLSTLQTLKDSIILSIPKYKLAQIILKAYWSFLNK